MIAMSLTRRLLGGVLGLCASLAAAEPLPSPLSLDHALGLAEQHPSLAQQQAQLELATAEWLGSQAETAAELNLSGRLRWTDPSPAALDDTPEDHGVSLEARKLLYDFGYSAAYQEANRRRHQAQQQYLLQARDRQRLSVMQGFFEVLLADLRYAHANELLAVAYVELDKKRQRHALGQLSDLDMARLEYSYQDAVQQRLRHQNAQRSSRAFLANALNRPGELPAELSAPQLTPPPALPEPGPLQAQAEQSNPRLLALAAQVEAAQAQVSAARAQHGPTVTGSAALAYWDKPMGSRDRAQIGLELELPLYTGGRAQAAQALALAELAQSQAALAEARLQVRQSVLESWLELQRLQAETKTVEALMAMRDMELDRSRSLYQLEFQTDLGDAMVGQSEAQLRQRENAYAIALEWEKMSALLGGEMPPAEKETAP